MAPRARLAADIGGTFTDVVLEAGREQWSAKVLTTAHAPAEAVLDGVATVLERSGVAAADVEVVIHGTTLATNAIIQRQGARTALVTTEGFRDAVAIAHENRFEQYDIFMERPEPLVPRHLRLGVPERLSATGEVLMALDEAAVLDLVPILEAEGVESVAIGFLHSYVDPAHEIRARELLTGAIHGLRVTLSAVVSPEIREYERFSTACANAYVQPLMAGYLTDLQQRLADLGIAGPLLMMLSNGGVCTLPTAIERPVGLIESGPAGGALLARQIANQGAVGDLLSFDMGGTTAKLCLLSDGEPATSREFEVARMYRFLKGSGLPLRIGVIDLVEIGAGGGSIATVDHLGRISVGPESAGSRPGPACYGAGGTRATVTDADVVAGRIEPGSFAGGHLALDASAAQAAVADHVARPLDIDLDTAVLGIGEIVDEHMANAARVHAIERGRDLGGGAMVAFGGAAPLHACRLADRLAIDTVIVPVGAGVGSAIGFLHAPVSYEAVRTCHQRLDRFDADAVNAVLADLRAEAGAVVGDASPGEPVVEARHASMRYVGQGHEIDVGVPVDRFEPSDHKLLQDLFEETYRSLYTRAIPHMAVEAMTWRVTVATVPPAPEPVAVPPVSPAQRLGRRPVFDAATGGWLDHDLYRRDELVPGARVTGPALVVESQTSTVVTPDFDAVVDGRGHLVLTRKAPGAGR